MAAKKQAKSTGKFNFQSSSVTGRNKKMLVLLLALVVVGAVIVIRSFAATTVYTINTPDLVGANNPAWALKNASVVQEPAGKKSQNVTEVTAGGSLTWNVAVNPGSYEGCFTVKPMTADGAGGIGFGVNGTGQGYGGGFTVDGINQVLGTYKEVCLGFTIKDATTKFQTGISFDKGTWRVTSFVVRIRDTGPQTVDLVNAFNIKDDRFTFKNATVVNENGTPIIELAPGGQIEYKSTSLLDGDYRFCFGGHMTAATDTGSYAIGRLNRGGAMDLPSDMNGDGIVNLYDSAILLNGSTPICTPQTVSSYGNYKGISTADPLWVTMNTTKGTWRFKSFTIQMK